MQVPAIATYVPFEVVFPGERPSFQLLRDTIRSISRTDALLWCARINLALVNASAGLRGHAVQQELALRFLSSIQLDRINVWARINHRERGTLAIFTRPQLLELASWIALLGDDHPDDGNTFQRAAVRDQFVRAAVLVASMWGQRMEARGDIVLTGDRSADRQRAVGSFRQGMAGAHIEPRLALILARSAAFCGRAFCDTYPAADEEYKAKTGLTLEEASLLAIGTIRPFLAIPGETWDPPFINRELFASQMTPRAREAFLRYQAIMSQTPEEFASELDRLDPQGRLREKVSFHHRGMRARPLLAASRARSIVLDFSFFTQSMQFGPVFMLAKAYPRKIDQIFGAFGDSVESYVHEILCAMYPSTLPLVRRFYPSPTAQKGPNEVEVCDAVVVGEDGFIFMEVKAVFLNENAALASTPEYVAALKSKYAHVGDSISESRDLGVTQLARNIRELATGMSTAKALPPIAGQVIFPVLVVLDDLLDAPGHQELLDAEMRKALDSPDVPSGPVIFDSALVRPLTLMTVRDLELLESAVEKVTLLRVIRDYLSAGTAIGFHNHLVINQADYGIGESRRVLDAAMETLDRATEFMFGKKAPP